MVAVSAGERIPIAQVNVSVCPLVSGVPCRHAPWSVVGPDWKTTQERWLHTIGNLTLTGYNPQLSDHPFPDIWIVTDAREVECIQREAGRLHARVVTRHAVARHDPLRRGRVR